jgi:hypothetical protein
VIGHSTFLRGLTGATLSGLLLCGLPGTLAQVTDAAPVVPSCYGHLREGGRDLVATVIERTGVADAA